MYLMGVVSGKFIIKFLLKTQKVLNPRCKQLSNEQVSFTKLPSPGIDRFTFGIGHICMFIQYIEGFSSKSYLGGLELQFSCCKQVEGLNCFDWRREFVFYR